MLCVWAACGVCAGANDPKLKESWNLHKSPGGEEKLFEGEDE